MKDAEAMKEIRSILSIQSEADNQSAVDVVRFLHSEREPWKGEERRKVVNQLPQQ